MLLGVFEAFAPPAAFSLVADFFPPERRTTANAVLNLGSPWGTGLASLTTIIIGSLGWRKTYFSIGCCGIMLATIALIGLKDPKRGRFDPVKIKPIIAEDEVKPSKVKILIEGFGALVQNKCTRWVLFGGMCRFWQGYTMSYYVVKYFAFYE
jgi:MFS family permease